MVELKQLINYVKVESTCLQIESLTEITLYQTIVTSLSDYILSMHIYPRNQEKKTHLYTGADPCWGNVEL